MVEARHNRAMNNLNLPDRDRWLLEHHGPIDWSKNYDSIAQIIESAQAAAAKLPRCQKAPKGWRCSSHKGHLGACAAWPHGLWTKLKWAWKLKTLHILLGKRP
jgi:hypothetical protein